MGQGHAWTFLTSHGVALLLICREPDIRIRDLAARIGVTERTAQSIVGDLVAGGYLEATRRGRRNVYRVVIDGELRHPAVSSGKVGLLIESLASVLT
jgi:predicted ArsR family transcriptional regulator